MIIPLKENLPIQSSRRSCTIDEKRAASFQQALGLKSSSHLPPTWGAVAMEGVFEILNQLQVNWLHLLHGTQSFTYENSEPSIPFEAESQSQLTDYRFRAGVHWLSFETEIREAKGQSVLMRSKSLIFVREPQNG